MRFAEVVRGGVNASVNIEKSHISDIKGTAINVFNPRELTVT